VSDTDDDRGPEARDMRDARIRAGYERREDMVRDWADLLRRERPHLARARKREGMSQGDRWKQRAGYITSVAAVVGVCRTYFWGPIKHIWLALHNGGFPP